MIKINNIMKVLEKEGTKEVEVPIYLDRSTITLMIRDENEGRTNVYLNHEGFSSIKTKETPEEILNLPELPRIHRLGEEEIRDCQGDCWGYLFKN